MTIIIIPIIIGTNNDNNINCYTQSEKLVIYQDNQICAVNTECHL